MRAQILAPTPENLARAAAALARGEVVGMPTETVYGLAGSALQPDALARIFDTKERPTFDPLIVHVGFLGKGVRELERLRLIDRSKLSDLASDRAQALIQAFWPGPLTLVLPKHADVPDLATSGLPNIAVRMPAHRVAQALIAAVGQPLAAPSANRFGRISPTTAQAVAEELGDRIDWILDGGPCEIGVESTVIRVEADGTLTQLRPGGLSREQIEKAAGCSVAVLESSSRPSASAEASGESTAPQAAPGMLDSHYAPRKTMTLLPAPLAELTPEHWSKITESASGAARIGLLIQQGDEAKAEAMMLQNLSIPTQAKSLSPSGDLHEAARTLFAKMREMDASDATHLFAEPCAIHQGLGHAIADRLHRACRNKLT